MEIYSIYEAIRMNMSLIDSNMYGNMPNNIIGIILLATMLVMVLTPLFILQGIGLYTMATKQGVKKRALAFVPFVNIWYIGKLAGECQFFNQRMKRAGMYAMIAQILTFVVSVLTIAAEQYLWYTKGAPQIAPEYGYYYWSGLSGFSLHVGKFFEVSGYVLMIFTLLMEIFLMVMIMGLCKKYTPNHYRLFGLLVLFVPMARFILIFVLRNRQPIDYEAYMRARREAYIRQQQYYNQQQYGTPYGNPYGNPYANNPYGRPSAPYGQQYGGEQSGPKPADPFEEFNSQTNGNSDDEPFAEMNGKSDDVFS